jgi:hypothetical protein
LSSLLAVPPNTTVAPSCRCKKRKSSPSTRVYRRPLHLVIYLPSSKVATHQYVTNEYVAVVLPSSSMVRVRVKHWSSRTDHWNNLF